MAAHDRSAVTPAVVTIHACVPWVVTVADSRAVYVASSLSRTAAGRACPVVLPQLQRQERTTDMKVGSLCVAGCNEDL
jgi:hypothetical protein